MNDSPVSQLLERAAASVKPAEIDPVTRMVSLGRRSVKRRRTVLAVAAAIVAVVAVPLVMARTGPSPDVAGRTVSYGGVSVAVPQGWQTITVPIFDPCTARKHIVYLSERFDIGIGQPSSGPGPWPNICKPKAGDWIALVLKGVAPTINPERTLVEGGQLLEATQYDRYLLPSVWTYRPMNDVIMATAAFIGGDQGLLGRITWPSGPPAPASGGLALPAHITSATSIMAVSNAMTVATDTKTLKHIRTSLAALHDQVPAGQECALNGPGSTSISLGSMTVILGDASCPQAISTGGGRVRVPPGLGDELLGLIEASDRAASGHPGKK